MTDEYIYRICGIGPGASESREPVAVAPGQRLTWVIPVQTHRRSRRKAKRWPHAPTKRIPLPPRDVAYYRVSRGAPMMTHTGRILNGSGAAEYGVAFWTDLSESEQGKPGRSRQLVRMLAKARRRQMKEGGSR